MSRKAILLPEADILQRLGGISEGTFQDFYTYGVDSLKHIFPPDGKLPVIRKGNGGRAGYDYFCDERHIESVENIPRLKDGKIKCGRATYLTLNKTNHNYGISRAYLEEGTENDVEELKGKIRAKTIIVREEKLFRFREMTLVHEGDCAKIRKTREGNGAPTTTELVAKRGFSDDELKRHVRAGGTGTRRVNRQSSSGKVSRAREWTNKAIARVQKARIKDVPATRWAKITDKEAKERYGFSPTTLRRWGCKGGCPYLTSRMLRRKKLDGIWYNDKQQLEEISKNMGTPRDAPHDDEHGRWIPTITIQRTWKIDDGLAWNWGNVNCQFLGRRARCKEIDRPHPKIPGGKLLVYHEWDFKKAVENRQKGIRPMEPIPEFCPPASAASDGSEARAAEQDNGEATAKKRGGRNRSKKTEEVLRFCWEGYTQGRKLSAMVAESKRRHGKRAAKSEAAVNIYAHRYANRHKLHCTRPDHG